VSPKWHWHVQAMAISCACCTITIRWLSRDESAVHVAGDRHLETFAWEASPGYTLHLPNYTNPNAQHGWLESTYPLGPQTVGQLLPDGVKVILVELLRAWSMIPFRWDGGALRFTIPRVEDYDVAAVTVGLDPTASVAPRSTHQENWSCELSGSANAP
jgi:hypothetical protein